MYIAMALAAAGAAGGSDAAAEPVRAADAGTSSVLREARRRDVSVAAFVMHQTEARLPTIPYKIVTGQLSLRRAYAVDVTVAKTVVQRFDIPLGIVTLRGNSLEIEGAFLQHFGRENSTEVAAAAVIRSGQFPIVGRTSGNVAWGNGLSYAVTPFRYEFGRDGIRGVDTVRLQYHMSFETELTSAAAPNVHVALRLHHRSGIYGIISPSKTGSNYLGIGLRVDLSR